MIHQVVKTYDFSRMKPCRPEMPYLDPAFVIRFRMTPAECPETHLISHDCGVGIWMCDKSKSPDWDREFNDRKQNFYSLTSADGTCRVLEAGLWMHPHSECTCRVGFPLVLCGDLAAEHEFAVMFDGVHFQILCDGEVMDRDAPQGAIQHPYDAVPRCVVQADCVRELFISRDLKAIVKSERVVDIDTPIQYYTPYGFNTWVGDVVTYCWKGQFHVFYLLDRRHHCSRKLAGAHVFAHLVSADLKDWTDYGLIFDLEEQWQTVGTGNAFEYDGKLCIGFGWHTERTKPYNERATWLFMENLRRDGNTGEFHYDELGTLTPAGGSYATSADGIHFEKSDVLMHYLTNPSIFNQPDGKLHLIQDGVWESDHPGSWTLVEKGFPPRAPEAFSLNCLDCPAFFKLGGWEYLFVGFVGYYGRPDRAGESWRDLTELGFEPADGMSVPMAADFNGRMIAGGWLNGNGWGSCLVLREYIPLGGGRVGSRWIPEALPAFGQARPMAAAQELPPARDVLLTMAIPAGGVARLTFEGDGAPCTLMVDSARQRAQWSSGEADELETFREQRLKHPEYTNQTQVPNRPSMARNYARAQLAGLENGFELKVIVHRDRKMNTAVLDAELGGMHVLTTHRNDLKPRTVRLAGQFADAAMAELNVPRA